MFANDTVLLEVHFKDYQGNSINPEDIKLTIYSPDETLVEEITQEIINKSIGKYEYEYTATDSDFIFEFSGFFNEKKVLARQRVKVKFY